MEKVYHLGRPDPANDPPVQVIRIPQDGSPMETFLIETTMTKNRIDSDLKTFPLGHMPDLRGDWEHRIEAFARRTMVIARWYEAKNDPKKIMTGVWVLFKIADKNCNLKLNNNEAWVHDDQRLVYGDAFLCKLKGKFVILHQAANYARFSNKVLTDWKDEVKDMLANLARSTGSDIILDKRGNYRGPQVSAEQAEASDQQAEEEYTEEYSPPSSTGTATSH